MEHEKEHSQGEAGKYVDKSGEKHHRRFNPRSTLRKWKTNVHIKKAVITTVPLSASNAAPLSVMIGV